MENSTVKSEGKRGNGNALKHGAFSGRLVLPDEDVAAFRKLQADVELDLQPEGFVQRELADGVARCMWRQRRIANVARLGDLVAGTRQQDRELAVTSVDVGATEQITEKAQDMRAQLSAERTFNATIRWARLAIDNAHSHADFDTIIGELSQTAGIDANLYRRGAISGDISIRRERLKELIKDLSSDTFVANEMALMEAALHASISRVFPIGIQQEIDLAARVDAELDRAVKRYHQLKVTQANIKRMTPPQKPPEES